MFSSKYSKALTVVLIIVIIGIIGTIGYFIYDVFVVQTKKNDAQDIVNEFNNASIKKEFEKKSTDGDDSTPEVESGIPEASTEKKKVYMEGYEVMGTISIPKTGIEYPILSEVTTKSLETSVAILYGVGLNQPGNTTIVGHNYRNGLFFSDNKKLSNGDIIKITDQTGTTITYEIYNMYETSPSDASYMQRDTQGAREISLSTCTDDSSARLIILAKEK